MLILDANRRAAKFIGNAHRGDIHFALLEGLGFGQFETKLFEERFDQMIIPAAWNGSGFGLQVFAPELHPELQLDESGIWTEILNTARPGSRPVRQGALNLVAHSLILLRHGEG